jgi:hypothetical protein
MRCVINRRGVTSAKSASTSREADQLTEIARFAAEVGFHAVINAEYRMRQHQSERRSFFRLIG